MVARTHDAVLQAFQQRLGFRRAGLAHLQVHNRRNQLQVVLHAVMHLAQEHLFLVDGVFKAGFGAHHPIGHTGKGTARRAQLGRRMRQVHAVQTAVPLGKAPKRARQHPHMPRHQPFSRPSCNHHAKRPHNHRQEIRRQIIARRKPPRAGGPAAHQEQLALHNRHQSIGALFARSRAPVKHRGVAFVEIHKVEPRRQVLAHAVKPDIGGQNLACRVKGPELGGHLKPCDRGFQRLVDAVQFIMRQGNGGIAKIGPCPIKHRMRHQ